MIWSQVTLVLHTQPSAQTDTYTAVIKCRDFSTNVLSQISGSPFTLTAVSAYGRLTVANQSSAVPCFAPCSSLGLVGSTAGVQASFQVTARDINHIAQLAGSDVVAAAATEPSLFGSLSVADHGNGTYGVTYGTTGVLCISSVLRA